MKQLEGLTSSGDQAQLGSPKLRGLQIGQIPALDREFSSSSKTKQDGKPLDTVQKCLKYELVPRTNVFTNNHYSSPRRYYEPVVLVKPLNCQFSNFVNERFFV